MARSTPTTESARRHFRHEQAPPPKVDARKAALFNEVLKKVAPGDAPVVDDAELDIPDLDAESDVDVDAEADAGGAVDADDEVAEPAPLEDEKPKKGRGRPPKK